MPAGLQTLDLVVFVGSLLVVMAVGLIAGIKENTTEDYFLAGRKIPWWGVAASIFGSNVSANHIVGFVGAGFALGFAHSHYELGAIAGLMLLAYGFLPVYRKLNVYTLSEYLSLRYNEACRLVYAVFMILIMVVVQMTGGLYIGSRAMNGLLAGTPLELGYNAGVLTLAAVAAVYTIMGGLKAVVWTDIIQSLLLLAAGILVCLLALSQPEIGGWNGLMRLDAAAEASEQKMHLYLDASHKDLPWSGVLTGLLALHFFYWGTNQFIAQRALAARSDHEARLGIVAAGFFKLLIPFVSIGAGIAAFYLFQNRDIQQDEVFVELMKRFVTPMGMGLIGLVAAGLIGAILSSIDSMMNSAATIVTMDVYKRYVNPDASQRRLILIGRLSIIGFVAVAAAAAMLTYQPDSNENFFLKIVDQQSMFTPGLLVAFGLGMFWRRATGAGALAAIVGGPVISLLLQRGYAMAVHPQSPVGTTFGPELGTLHRVALATVVCLLVHVGVSLLTKVDPEKAKNTWMRLGRHAPGDQRRLVLRIAAAIGFYIVLAWLMVTGALVGLKPSGAAILAAAWTMGICLRGTMEARARESASSGETAAAEIAAGETTAGQSSPEEGHAWPLWQDDRLWAGVLLTGAISMMFYYY